jgi:hypothetical protein
MEETFMKTWLVVTMVELIILKTVGIAVVIWAALRLAKEEPATAIDEWTPRKEGSNGIAKLGDRGF